MIAEADWHPDIIEFAICKIQNPKLLDKLAKEGRDPLIRAAAEKYLVRDAEGNPVGVADIKFMTGANISVLISDDFMEAVFNDGDWELRFPDLENFTPEQKEIYDNEWHLMGDVRKWEERGLPVKVYHRLKARALWHLFMVCARYSAEPGVIFIDRYNKESNAWYYSPIVVTNPCGEQGLPGNANCNLGAINLEKMFNHETQDVDWELLEKVTFFSQRFSDNIIDVSMYPLPEIEEMSKAERRIGKGVMGLADLMIYLKLPYGSDAMLEKLDKIFEFITVNSYIASSLLAKEKGAFPLFDCEKYLQSGFVRRLPEHVKELIRQHGIRNVCSMTVAPTGSTGAMIGVATGLEPYFAFKFYRSGRLGKFIEMNVPIAQKFFDENLDATELPEYYVSAMQLSPEGHVKVQGVIQKWVDSSLSKTANAPADYTVDDTRKLYELAYKLGCKGTTIN